ncbi:MAG: hypothetical protein DRP42_03535 [Tenericutes bacterium]|nr:MAG: hypothetical protein DRP42_03535 [Mycoplasmatota bacterium]
MSVLLPRQDKTILNSNYVVVKNLDRFEIHTLNEKSLIQIRVVLPMVTMLLRNFGIIQKDVIVKMDNSHFSYEKMNVREERLEASLKKSQTSTSPKTGFKLIKSPSSVKDDLKNIYYEGVIFSIDIIKTRSSQLIVKYGVANNNQAMIVNTFTTKELYKPKYKVGDYARFYGDTKYNSYSSEYQISGKSIQMLDKEMFDNIPECISTAKRTEFHVHTNMSQMDATADMSEYLELADK